MIELVNYNDCVLIQPTYLKEENEEYHKSMICRDNKSYNYIINMQNSEIRLPSSILEPNTKISKAFMMFIDDYMHFAISLTSTHKVMVLIKVYYKNSEEFKLNSSRVFKMDSQIDSVHSFQDFFATYSPASNSFYFIFLLNNSSNLFFTSMDLNNKFIQRRNNKMI